MNANGYTDVALTWDEKIILLTPKPAQDNSIPGTPRIAGDGVEVPAAVLQ